MSPYSILFLRNTISDMFCDIQFLHYIFCGLQDCPLCDFGYADYIKYYFFQSADSIL